MARWTPDEAVRLEAMLDDLLPVDVIARRLHRSIDSVRQRLQRCQLLSPTKRCLSLMAVARLFAVNYSTVTDWQQRGWLHTHHFGTKRQHVIDDLDLLDWIEDEDHWHEWDPVMLTDRDLRDYAVEIRRGRRFLTPKEAGDLLGITASAVYWRGKHGFLRMVRGRNSRWWIRSDWLEDARMVTMKPSQGHCRFSAAEDAFLREWRPAQPIRYLADALDRNYESTNGRCRFLGLSGPIIPHGERRDFWRQSRKLEEAVG